jgi:hypothetical protein
MLSYESNKIIQPSQIKIELMEHQKTAIYSMLELEKDGYKNAINGLERPKYLCREKKDENIKAEKHKKVVQKKAKKSVEVVALTKS